MSRSVNIMRLAAYVCTCRRSDNLHACAPELVRQLRRAAGDVQGVHGAAARPGAAALEQLQASVRRGPIHGLRAQWRRLHVAVTARLPDGRENLN